MVEMMLYNTDKRSVRVRSALSEVVRTRKRGEENEEDS